MHNDAIAQRHDCIKMQPGPVGKADLSAVPEVSDDRRPACIKMQICKQPVGVNGRAGYDVRPGSRPSGPICNCILPGGTPGADAPSTGALHRPADAYLHKGRAVPRTVHPAVDWSGAGQGSAKRDRWKPCLCWPEPFPSGGTRHRMRVGSIAARVHNCITRGDAADDGARLSPASIGLRNCIFAQAPPAAAMSGANGLPNHAVAHLHKCATAKAAASGCHGRPGSRPMQLHH